MKTQGRTKGWGVLGALLLLGALSGAAQAATSDSLTVTIRPTAQYSVDIATATNGNLLDLGNVALGASTFTVNVTTVEVQSTYSATDLTIQAQVISGGWSIDGDTTTQNTDAVQAWAVFTDTSIATTAAAQALAGAFAGDDVLQATARDVGVAGGGPQMYTVNTGAAGYKSMEDIPSSAVDGPASRSHLWLKFTLPPTTTTTNPQEVYVTVTAGAPNN